jgi:hypothetical protein
MLKNKGYETKELDKSSVVVPRTDYEALRERVNVSLHKIEVSLHGAMPAGQV